jgi:lipopolysaccharide export LptBFGC system permease protein LptF
VTAWDRRAAVRAFGATLVALAVVWLITAASDEGQLTVSARAGRTLPLAPLCSAFGAALALGTARVRAEVRALEALGRSPTESARAAVLGAAIPTIAIALAIGAASSVDVGGFYPRAPRGDTFVREGDGFVSATLGVRVEDDGEAKPLDGATPTNPDEGLPRGARAVAAATTAIAAIALALVAAHALLRPSMSDRRSRRKTRMRAATLVIGCALSTLVAFQAAAAHVSPAVLAVVPPLLLAAFEIASRRSRYRKAA